MTRPQGEQGEQGETGASGSPPSSSDGLASTAFVRGTGNVATGRVGRVGVSDNDVVAFAQDDVTIRMDCAANTSVALELPNSSGGRGHARTDLAT